MASQSGLMPERPKEARAMKDKISMKPLLLALVRLSDGDRHALVDMERAAAAAGLARDEATVASHYLHRRDWAHFELLTGRGYAQLTAAGLAGGGKLPGPARPRPARDPAGAGAPAPSPLA